MIKLNTFIEYLIQNDWEQVSYQDPRMLVFIRMVDGESQLVSLPSNEEYSDYAVQMEFAIHRLADCEGIRVEQARRKVSGEMPISAEDIVDLIEGKIRQNNSIGDLMQDIMQMIRHDILEEVLNDIKDYNSRLIEP